jgi:hypothetical protein
MSVDISAMGIKATLRAVPSYPVGFTMTQFADDGDSLNVPDMTIMSHAMGVNGDMVVWRTAVPCQVDINLIPGTDDCNNMENLFKLNLTQKNKVSSKDLITLTIEHPNGKVDVLTNGYIIAGKPIQDYSANGRAKTRTFRLVFENNIN